MIKKIDNLQLEAIVNGLQKKDSIINNTEREYLLSFLWKLNKKIRRNTMAEKTDTEVLIGGRVFTLSGYESEEYLQKIALYINNKVSEYNKVEGFKRQPVDTQAILLELNIADDYFKAKKQISLLEEDLAAKEKELYDLKHELVSAQIKLESTEKAMKSMQDDRSRESKK